MTGGTRMKGRNIATGIGSRLAMKSEARLMSKKGENTDVDTETKIMVKRRRDTAQGGTETKRQRSLGGRSM